MTELERAQSALDQQRQAHLLQGFKDGKAGLHMISKATTAYVNGWRLAQHMDLDLASAVQTGPFSAAEVKRMSVQTGVSVDVLSRIIRATANRIKERQ